MNFFAEAIEKIEKQKEDWISKLRKQGFKASHPNDGWVNRIDNKVCLCYPQFNEGLKVGDKMMIGSSDKDERPVEIIGVESGMLTYYLFKDINP